MSVLVDVGSVVAILFGIWGRFHWAREIGATHDTWYHLHVADKIRQERSLPKRIDQFLVQGPYDYPPILHVVLAILPSEIVFKYKWLLSPFVDLAHMALLYGVTYWVTGDPRTGMIALAVYATYPMALKQFTYLTPRVIGSLLVSVFLLVTFLAVDTGSLTYLVPAVFVGVLLLHTHKMSSQTVLFLSVFLAIWTQNPLYIIILLITVLLGIVLSAGHYLTILKGHINIINFWRRQYSAGRPPGVFGTRFGSTSDGDPTTGSRLERVKQRVKRHGWVLFVADGTWSFVALGILVTGTHPSLSPLLQQVAYWAAFIPLFAVLTQYVPKFKLVGEGHKYFIWGGFPSAILIAITVHASSSRILDLLYIGVLVAVLVFAVFRMKGAGATADRRNLVAEGEHVLEFISEADGESVMTLPPDMYYQLLYHTDKSVLFHSNPKIEAESYYPVPIEPLEAIVDEFDIDLILVDTARVAEEEFDLSTFERVFERDGYEIFRTDRSQ